MGLVCYKENSNEIIGINLTVLIFLKNKDIHPSDVRNNFLIPFLTY